MNKREALLQEIKIISGEPIKPTKIEAFKLRRLSRLMSRALPKLWDRVDLFFLYRLRDCQQGWAAYCLRGPGGVIAIGISDVGLAQSFLDGISYLLHEVGHLAAIKHTGEFLKYLYKIITIFQRETGLYVTMSADELRYNLSDTPAFAGCRPRHNMAKVERFYCGLKPEGISYR